MKSKIFLYLSLFLGLAFTACSDEDDFDVNTNPTPIVDANSVVTGSADVTATSAELHATVSGVQTLSASSYVVGFNYGTSESNLNQSVNGAFTEGNTIEATITGLTDGTVVYYQAFVKLQGKLTFTGEIKSLVTTDAVITTKEADTVSAFKAALGASVSGAPAAAQYGVVISGSDNEESVRDGLMIPAGTDANYVVEAMGLTASTDYYYTGYADLGSGIIYGDVKHFRTSDYDFDVENNLVDLGLSVKWAKFNIGAESETELGGRFGFGDVTGTMTTTITQEYPSSDIYKSNLDVATRAYGGKLTLPTAEQFKELFSSCTKEWTTVDGVAGCKLTGPNGNSIFLPAAGSRTINEISGEGVEGLYATGSLVGEGSKFAVAYNFSASTNGRVNTPVYQALSARAVSTAIYTPFDKGKLYKTWEIDYNDGKSIRFAGPVHFYGVDDCWRTVSNKEPIVGDTWSWEADASNSWAFGDCTGELTLTEDGKIIVKSQDGTVAEGTYTLNEGDKTITSDIDILHPSAMNGYANYKTGIKILQLADDKLSLGFFRDSDPATVSVNLIPQDKKYGLPVLFALVDGNWNGDWGTERLTILPDELEGKHTVVYEASAPSIMVSYLDIVDLKNKYPNSMVTITEIRCDGVKVPFDGSKFFYGDIEDNGRFRVELFNIYGKGGASGNVIESPFSTLTNAANDPAVNFSEKIEVDFTIVLDNKFSTGFAAVQKDWGASTWGESFNTPFEINIENCKYVPSKTSFDLKVESSSYTEPMMMFLQTDNLYSLFPNAKFSLQELVLDGKSVTGWDASKIQNISADGGGVHHRLELFNCYGGTANDCAFGVKNGDVMNELGFSTSAELKWTLDKLF